MFSTCFLALLASLKLFWQILQQCLWILTISFLQKIYRYVANCFNKNLGNYIFEVLKQAFGALLPTQIVFFMYKVRIRTCHTAPTAKTYFVTVPCPAAIVCLLDIFGKVRHRAWKNNYFFENHIAEFSYKRKTLWKREIFILFNFFIHNRLSV